MDAVKFEVEERRRVRRGTSDAPCGDSGKCLNVDEVNGVRIHSLVREDYRFDDFHPPLHFRLQLLFALRIHSVFAKGDPINANLLKEEILGLRDRGATVIFSTHNMASVEEVCDHITLINKSRNILSGSVEEIRRSAGGNNFEVVYRASDDELKMALADRAMMVGESRGVVGGYREAKIYVPKDEDLKGTIAAINESCGLRSLREVMPSMNDIFIRAVNGTL